MVGAGADVMGAEAGCERLTVFTVEGVDNARNVIKAFISGEEFGTALHVLRAAFVNGLEPGKEVVKVIIFVTFKANFIMEVLPTGAHGEDFHVGFREAESTDNILPDSSCGSGGQAHNWDIWERLTKPTKFLEGGSKVVTPF